MRMLVLGFTRFGMDQEVGMNGDLFLVGREARRLGAASSQGWYAFGLAIFWQALKS